jgi:hypothetical protein
MPLRLKQEEPSGDRLLIRNAAGEKERGPFAIEALRDMAEVGLLAPQHEYSADRLHWQAFSSDQSLMAAIFPPKPVFGYKAFEPETDREAAFDPVNLEDLLLAKPAAGPAPLELPAVPDTPVEPVGFDPKQLMEDNASRLRALEPEEEPAKLLPPVLQWPWGKIIRWSLAAVSAGFGYHWLGSNSGGFMTPILVIGAFTFAALLVVLDVIDWIIEFFSNAFAPSFRPLPNYAPATAALAKGDLAAALAGFEAVLRAHPREERAYLEAFALAAQLGRQDKVEELAGRAAKGLGARDWNLLRHSLEIRGIALPPE